MIIHTHVDISTLISNKDKQIVEKPNEEVVVKPVVRERKRKSIPTPIVEEPIVVEEKVEDEDLSKWLEEHTEN